jgi:PAS domain-containing protein
LAAEATPADQAAQQLLAHTLDGIGAGLVVTDRQGRVSALNDAAQRVLGWTQDEALGRSYWEVFAREGEASHAGPADINPVDLDGGSRGCKPVTQPSSVSWRWHAMAGGLCCTCQHRLCHAHGRRGAAG